eukprot:11297718-Prorocentrum_lima.AAC.1
MASAMNVQENLYPSVLSHIDGRIPSNPAQVEQMKTCHQMVELSTGVQQPLLCSPKCPTRWSVQAITR